MTFRDVYNSMNKSAAQMLTPEAQAAATPPPPAPPMGAPAGAPMPPPGAPMDPAMMGAPPMPGPGMPPPGAWMQDPMFMQLLQQSGVQIDPNTGTAIDTATGQPIPPQQLDQAYMMFIQQMMAQGGGAPMPPPPGAPMDPAMMGAPAADPTMGGMPQQGMLPDAGGQMPTPQDQANMIASIIMDSVNAVMDQKLAAVDKKISAFADKLDSIKAMLDDMVLNGSKQQKSTVDDSLNTQLQNQLRNAQPLQSSQMPKSASAQQKGSILSLLRSSK